MKLENVDPLRDNRRHRDPGGRVRRPAVQNLVDISLAAHEARRVGTEREVRAHRTDRSSVPDSKSETLHRIIEVLEIMLPEAQTDVLDVIVDVTQVVEQY